ncbi:MAG: hypothetical protein EXS63_04895 [Candidatus Omnitrophica bacterium]|nr:hypothetical protein [Candidatus Omnitrophota bacterium]
MTRKFNLKKRFIAVFVGICFTLTSAGTAPASAHAISLIEKQNTFLKLLPSDITKIKIPKTYGGIQGVFQGNYPGTVILIRGAHVSAEAQKNIAQLIPWLSRQYGITLVKLEGMASNLDTQMFSSFPDQGIGIRG